jgi:uncharacterized HAD superfamily protein
VLGYEDISTKTMTFSKKTNTQLTDAEYNEMIALKNAIDYDISQVAPEKMEEFSDYLVRSLKERGG